MVKRVQRKDMNRSDWPGLLRRETASRPFTYHGARALTRLFVIREIAKPIYVRRDFASLCIADAGYGWLQIAVEGSRVWLLAVYDAEGELVQFYFDITDGNRFDDPDNPRFDDLYLDVVLTRDGDVHVLDEDELGEALAAGYVSPEQAGAAESACRELVAYLERDAAHVMDACRRADEELMARIKTRA